MSFEERLRTDLHEVPIPTLTPAHGLADRALAGARRQNRLRAVAVAGVAALAVAGAVPAVRDVLPGPGFNPAAPACADPLPARTPSSTWEYFDPLTYLIDAEALDGYSLLAYDTASYYQQAVLHNPVTQRLVTVTLHAADGVPHYQTLTGAPKSFDPATGQPGGSIDGVPAFWLPGQADTPTGAEGLAWRWASGAWAFVTVAETTSTTSTGPTADAGTLRAEAATLAPLVKLGDPEPVTSPFSMPAPQCSRLAYTSLAHGMKQDASPFTRFALGFVAAGQPEATNPLLARGDSAPAISVTADDGARAEDKPGRVTEEVDGHPAIIGIDRLVVYDVGGLALEITTPSTDLEPTEVFHHIDVYPGARESSHWGPPLTT